MTNNPPTPKDGHIHNWEYLATKKVQLTHKSFYFGIPYRTTEEVILLKCKECGTLKEA